MYYLGFV